MSNPKFKIGQLVAVKTENMRGIFCIFQIYAISLEEFPNHTQIMYNHSFAESVLRLATEEEKQKYCLQVNQPTLF